MFWNKKKSGIVNVKMVITEEKILSNISKVQKLIDPNSKKTIVQLDDDTYFKDLVESIKMYLVEYPNKKTFPESVYKAAYELVEFATNQFEENTKQIEELIRQREANIARATTLKDLLKDVQDKKEGWKDEIQSVEEEVGEDIVSALSVIGKSRKKQTDQYNAALRLVNARISNLDSNLHIEIDMERIEDRSKALSYIGLEIADSLKEIPVPNAKQEAKKANVKKAEAKKVTAGAENVKAKNEKVEVNKAEKSKANVAAIKKQEKVVENKEIIEAQQDEEEDIEYIEETQVEVPEKKSLWQRIKESKVGRAVSLVFRIRIVIDTTGLPEGRGE